MGLIESLNHVSFSQYLRKYGNTICGRHPIGVFLGAVEALKAESNGLRMECKTILCASQAMFKSSFRASPWARAAPSPDHANQPQREVR